MLYLPGPLGLGSCCTSLGSYCRTETTHLPMVLLQGRKHGRCDFISADLIFFASVMASVPSSEARKVLDFRSLSPDLCPLFLTTWPPLENTAFFDRKGPVGP